MAMDESTIWFNYRLAMEQAARLDEIAREMEQNSNQNLGDALNCISGSWTGDNAKRYYGKTQQLQARIKASASALRTAASDVRKQAERIRRAELANAEIAERRDY